MSEQVFDHIIVGGGTAGCLLANRLSARRDRRVLLVEAGGNDDYPWIHIPVGYLWCIGNPRTDWLWRTETEPGLNGRALRYPRGKVLGGCSSINGMIYMRGQARDYDGWARLSDDPDWRWEACLPWFKAHEDHWRGADAAHAAPGFDPGGRRAGGEWRVERQRLSWEILDAFAAAAQQAGIPASEDFNRGSNEGVGYFEVNQRGGLRWNATKAFLRPVQHRDNLQVWTGAQVTRLLTTREADGALRVSGLALRPEGHDHDAHTAGQPLQVQLSPGGSLVLAAGAIGTPQLMQLSGLGPAADLQALGIPVQADLPGVGAHLQDHLQIRTVFGVSGVRTLNTMAANWPGKLRIAADYLLRRRGPMSMAPSQLGCFTRSSPELPWPDLEYHVQPLSLDAFGEPLHRHDAFTASVCHLNPTSRGTVRLRSPRPEDAPLIRPGYLSTDEDRAVALAALRLTRRIVAQPALARYQPQELRPGATIEDEAELLRLTGDIATTIFHPVGTCRMGRADDPAAVVDSRLRVRGVRGLHIADASVMPTITSGNTCSPTLMIAERAAHWIAGST
ncbi:MAG: hypothetical protein RL223_14 [Pseudomonadota bacterium]